MAPGCAFLHSLTTTQTTKICASFKSTSGRSRRSRSVCPPKDSTPATSTVRMDDQVNALEEIFEAEFRPMLTRLTDQEKANSGMFPPESWFGLQPWYLGKDRIQPQEIYVPDPRRLKGSQPGNSTTYQVRSAGRNLVTRSAVLADLAENIWIDSDFEAPIEAEARKLVRIRRIKEKDCTNLAKLCVWALFPLRFALVKGHSTKSKPCD